MNEIKRKVFFNDQFKIGIKKGVDILADAVKITMGPKGKLVLIQRKNMHPIVTKDGVTVAQSINLENELQNLGVKVIKEAASRTAEEAGDGTTTSTVLAQAIYHEGQKMLSAGYQYDAIKQGIDKSLVVIKETLSTMKKDITNDEELNQVAMISANGEKDISKLIVDAIKAAGVNGNVIVEEAKGFKSELNIVDGFKLNRGYLSPYFVTDKNKMTCEFSKPLILLADREFNSIKDLMMPLELALEAGRPILVVANDIQGDALQGLVLNRVKGSLKVSAIKSPGFGVARHDMLLDLQSVVGGTVLTQSTDISQFKFEDFGSCEKIIISRTSTLVISKDNNRSKEDIKQRMEAIKSRLSESYLLEDAEKEVLEYRLSQLSGGISILRVGAATESELIERYDRVDDALNATKAAMEEGILPGGGVALVKCLTRLKEEILKERNPDVIAGMQIMSRSITMPFKQIILNGNGSADGILSKLEDSKNNNIGYDSRNKKFGNMYELGIVDPHKVVRCAIENATSAASMLLNTGCCMIDMKQSIEEDN